MSSIILRNGIKSLAFHESVTQGVGSWVSLFSQCVAIISQPAEKSSVILAILSNLVLDFFWQ